MSVRQNVSLCLVVFLT